MNKAPASVMVLGIIGIVFASFGILGLIWSGINQFVDIFPNPMMDALRHDMGYVVGTSINFCIAIPSTILELASAIGSLKLKQWARRGMIVYAWIAIVHGVLGAVFNTIYLFPRMMAAMPAGASPAFIRTVMVVSSGCGLLLAMAYPACIIYFFRRPHVVDAFNGIFPAPRTNFPVEMHSPPPEPPSQFP